MTARILLCIMAAVLIAAHFLRTGDLVLAALCLAMPLLFLVRRRWSLLLLEALMYLTGAAWLLTAWRVATMRRDFGEPWARAAVILLAVAALSVLAGGLLRAGAWRRRYLAR